MIVTLLRWSKENYYKNYFDKNKNNIKKTWDGIRIILAVSKKNTINIDQLNYKNRQLSSNSDKANALNDFFTNIGPSIEKKVPKAKNDFKFYLKNPNPNKMELVLCDETEVNDIIKGLESSKACGPHSVPTSLLKTASTFFVPVLTNLINKSLLQGTFPQLPIYPA